MTALQKHAAFFDGNKDGVVTYSETYQGEPEPPPFFPHSVNVIQFLPVQEIPPIGTPINSNVLLNRSLSHVRMSSSHGSVSGPRIWIRRIHVEC